MIILSHTNLSGINLGGINLSEIKLGMPSGKGTGGEETFDPASFDEAWTVTGKTNDDEDRAAVKNLTGNWNDLVLSNFAFSEDSGYGLYHSIFYKKTDIEFYSKSKISFSKTQLDAQQYQSATIIAPLTSDSSFNIKIKVNGLKEGVRLKWGWGNSYVNITEDGTHILEKPENGIRHLIINFDSEFDPDHIITIEQIPDYEGYLVTDGVDDSVRALNINLGEKFTLIGEWRLLSNTPIINAGVSLHPQLHIFNRPSDGINVNFRSVSTTLYVKTLKAICSNGRCYDDDWNDLNINVGDTISSNINTLFLGYNGANFTKIAFKNLAVYDGKVLTKDQCINAYNYLQTLKEK